jgi:hypothetical protein
VWVHIGFALVCMDVKSNESSTFCGSALLVAC